MNEYEERLRFAFEGGKFGIWEINTEDRKVTIYNKYLTALLGLSVNQISFDDWKEYVHPEDIMNVRMRYDNHLKGEDFVLECRIICNNGEYKWISVD